jgi:hypothetical protein
MGFYSSLLARKMKVDEEKAPVGRINSMKRV